MDWYPMDHGKRNHARVGFPQLTQNDYPFGTSVTNGISISSNEIPPCWNVFL